MHLRTIATQAQTVAKWVFIAFSALFALLLVLYFFIRDRRVAVATKLALAGKHREAEDLIRGALRDKGETEARLSTLGHVLMEQSRLEEALAAFEAARRLARRPANAMNNSAMALRKLGRLDEARQLLDDALQLDPNHFVALTNSCVLLAEMGLKAEAFDRLDRAEEIYQRHDPSHVKPWKPLLEECPTSPPAEPKASP